MQGCEFLKILCHEDLGGCGEHENDEQLVGQLFPSSRPFFDRPDRYE